MRGLLVICLCAAGCGRVAFDATGDAGDARRDGGVVVDAPVTSDPCALASAPMLAAYSMDAADMTATGKLLDVSGNGHLATIVGAVAPSYSAGKRGQALDFSSADAFVEVTTLPFDSTPGAFVSVAFWYRVDSSTVDQGVIALPSGPSPAPPRYDLWLNTDRRPGPTLCINTGLGECWGVADSTLLQRWVHVVVVFANGPETNGQIYIDGATRPMACHFGTCDQSRVAMTPFELGTSDPAYTWRGLLDDVRIYPRALTPAEVATLHACGSGS